MKGSHDSASADALMRLGVTLARSGFDELALLIDDPGPGVVDAADWIDAAMLALSAEFNRDGKSSGGAA